MSKQTLGWILGASFVALLAFGMGYGLYPLLHSSAPFAPLSAQAAAAGDAYQQGKGSAGGLDPFWEAWGLLDQYFLGEQPDESERFRGAVAGMVATYGDPYTLVQPPVRNELDADQWRGSFGGIGATIELSGTRFLLYPLAEHPAASAGVLAGDELRAVDGLPLPGGSSTDDVVALLRGEVGTRVELGLRRVSVVETAPITRTRDLTISVTRAEIRTPSVEASLLPDSSIGYLRQTAFTERSAEELEDAVNELSATGADRFIWDLRGNPGGLLSAAIAGADLWLRSGAIVVEMRTGGDDKTTSAGSGDAGEAFPLVVLVDGGSASASELAAGALQHHNRARLVGSRTFGKGSVQTLYALSDSSSLHITTAQWLTPGRRQITGEGLSPDIIVEEGADALAVAREAVLEQPQP